MIWSAVASRRRNASCRASSATVEADFVAIAKTVNDRAGWRRDPHRDPKERVNDHAAGEHGSRETHDTHACRSARRLARLAIDSDPHFMRRLRTDVVELKRSQQADDGFGDGRSHHGLRFGFGGLNLGEAIEPVPEVFDGTVGDETLQATVRDPERRNVTRMEECAQAGFLQPRCIQGVRHPKKMIPNVGTYAQLPTFSSRKCRHSSSMCRHLAGPARSKASIQASGPCGLRVV